MGNIYITGLNRKQQQFFPPSIDEYVSEDNPVRVIDEYVELLDMVELGFTKASLNSHDGRPAYHPKLLLKIYIYGYLNKIRSSRKLEAEIKRNVEMMWLCAGLTPGYKTIANFRKENSKPLKKVFREFVLLLKDIEVITGDIVAVDGAFLRANASKNRLITKRTIVSDIKEIDDKIDDYLKKMTFLDNEEKKDQKLSVSSDQLTNLKKKKERLDNHLALLEAKGITQYNQTDPDAMLMVKPAHNLMAYNTQIVVDERFKFIVATEASSQSNDTKKLYDMAMQTKKITDNESMIIIGDSGYYSAKEIDKCRQDNINVIVPIPNKQRQQKKRGYYTQEEFRYDKEQDCYICPSSQKIYRTNSIITKENGTVAYVYRAKSKTCKACPLKKNCIPPKTPYKSISRIEYTDTVQAHKKKMSTPYAKKLIKKRGSIAEHPFGTIKQTLGWSHYLVRGLEKVSGENALIMFTYNFRRLLNLIGITLFRKLIIALKEGNIEAIKAQIRAYIAYFEGILGISFNYLNFQLFRLKYSKLLARNMKVW